MCISIASDPEEVEDRVIDRSGDIDQRPPEERHLPPSNILLFQGAPDKGPLQHPPIARSLSAIPEEPRRANYVKGNELGEMAKRLQKELDKRGTKAKAQLDALTQKIEAQEKRCLAPKLDDELQQIRLKRQKVLIMNGPTLANCLRDERSRLADLEQFKSRNRLLREPHYPESPTLAIGILMMLILAEAGLNGVLFAETSDQGLFGGWLEALVLAVTNVGVAFLFGRIALPQLHRRGFFLSTAAAATSLAGFASLIAINLFAAHYRDFKVEFAKHELSVLSQPLAKKEPTVLTSSQKPGYPGKIAAAPKPDLAAANAADRGEPRWRGAEAEAIRRAISAPVDLKSFTSFFLLITGLCGAAIAALDGYKFDDPYPGYGKLHRRYLQTRERSTAVLRSILAQSNAIMEGNFLAIARKIDNHAHELAKLVSLHHSYAGEYKALKDELDEALREAEQELSCHERLLSKLPDRERFGAYAFSVAPLQELSDKHIKFYETQEKKLKALQRSAQREQDDALGVFDAASADFQKLLAEASHASLLVALPDERGKAS